MGASDPEKAILEAFRAMGPEGDWVLVGGAVRDRMLGRPGADWDVATALDPHDVLKRARKIGLRAIPTGLQHGTVTLLVADQPVEVTTFRGESAYADGRRPDAVQFGVSLTEDLARRDFTINAMALPLDRVCDSDWRDHVVDPFGGRKDLEAQCIRAVGAATTRFDEDGLRPFRACRFAAQLGFDLDPETRDAIPATLGVAAKIAPERVFQELQKLLLGRDADRGLRLLAETGLLQLWAPELEPMRGCGQNAYHAFDVWEHTLRVVAACPQDPDQRWAGLLHDAGKPETRTVDPDGSVHFYGHEAVSQRLSEALLRRLKTSNARIKRVAALVLHHGHHPTEAWGPPALRRLLQKLADSGLTLDEWSAFKRADLQGKGVDVQASLIAFEAQYQRLRAEQEKASALTLRDLALDGHALQRCAAKAPGPWLGTLQKFLLEAVLEDPALNETASLERLVQDWLAGHERE